MQTCEKGIIIMFQAGIILPEAFTVRWCSNKPQVLENCELHKLDDFKLLKTWGYHVTCTGL